MCCNVFKGGIFTAFLSCRILEGMLCTAGCFVCRPGGDDSDTAVSYGFTNIQIQTCREARGSQGSAATCSTPVQQYPPFSAFMSISLALTLSLSFSLSLRLDCKPSINGTVLLSLCICVLYTLSIVIFHSEHPY